MAVCWKCIPLEETFCSMPPILSSPRSFKDNQDLTWGHEIENKHCHIQNNGEQIMRCFLGNRRVCTEDHELKWTSLGRVLEITCVHTQWLICLTLCHSMDYSPQDSSIHRILQARTLKWVAISYSKGSSWPRDWHLVFCISFVGQGDSLSLAPPGKEMPTHSSILAWKIPRTEEPWGLQSIGLQRIRHNWTTEHSRT